MTTRRRGLTALAIALAVVATLVPPAGPSPVAAADVFTTRGSITQVATWGHAPGTQVRLFAADGGDPVATGVADAQGAYLFRGVEPGPGYTVAADGATSDPVTVTAPDDHPAQDFYEDIELTTGFGYIPTRDGTLLSANITMPLAGTGGSDGPYPTVVEYSGYDPSEPGALLPESLPYLLLGYAVVAVNMRGSACSGGAFDYYEPATSTDGYDIIEAVAAQPWSNGDVGMVGISYSGISQLYVAATQPPHLRAITPLSPYADAYRGILYPGGIRNEGFALEWALDRQASAAPAAKQWVRDRIAGGDTVCAQNQVLRLQSRDIEAEVQPYRFDLPDGEYLSISSFADRIEVPTYLAAQFQDEQTGGSAVFLANILQESSSAFRATFANGTHSDPLGPTEYPRVIEFVDFYVGRKVSDLSAVRALAPGLMRGIFEDPIEIPLDRFTGMSFADALAAYEAEDPIRVRYEVGGVAGKEGAPYATAERSYPAWPVPGTTAERWYLQPDGALARTAPTVADDAARATTSYRYAPDEVAPPTYEGGSTDAMWKRHPDVDWRSPGEDAHLTFTTPPATATSVYAGSGSVDLWVGSTAADTDLEAVITEVRPDGKEVYVQSGWLRASHRALDPARSTELRPWPTHDEADAAPLPAGELVPVRMELFPFTHVVRPGSRLRLTIQAPGGNQPFWDYTLLAGEATNRIGHSAGRPSSVVLPLLPDPGAVAALPAAAPSCSVPGVTVQAQSLRNQPCRDDRSPRRPTGVTVTDVDTRPGCVRVAWTAPRTWPGGATPTGSTVALSTGDTVTTPAGATSVEVDGLAPGTVVTAVVTPTYADGGGVPSNASPPLTVASRSANESFLLAAFEDFLDREPAPGQLAPLVAQLDGGTMSRRTAVEVLAGSPEWVGALIDRLYEDTLGRPADPEGRAFWHDQIVRRARTVAQVAASFYASPEYVARVGGTSTAWVDDLYEVLLERPADAEGRAYWVAQAGARGRGWVALRFFQSVESARTRVQRVYQQLLARAGEPEGVAFWVPRVIARGDIALAVELAVSAEYYARARTRFP